MTFEIETHLYQLLSTPEVRKRLGLSGGIYLGNDRPNDSQKEDIVIQCLACRYLRPKGQAPSEKLPPPSGQAQILLYVPDHYVYMGRIGAQYVSPRYRLKELCQEVISALRASWVQGNIHYIIDKQTLTSLQNTPTCSHYHPTFLRNNIYHTPLRANDLRVFPPYLVLPKRRWRQAGAPIPPAICFSVSRPPHSPLTTSSSCYAPKRYSLSPLVRATSPRFSASPRCPMANTYTWSRTGFAATTPPPRASCTTPACSLATPRYRQALLHREDPLAFAHFITQAGYATDPDYEGKLRRIISMIND